MNIRNCVLTSLLVLCSGISSTSLAVGTGYSDDTELFIYDFAKAGDFRPKVLFIFDNSGSMADTTLMAKEEYDPEFTYPACHLMMEVMIISTSLQEHRPKRSTQAIQSDFLKIKTHAQPLMQL